MGNPHSGDPRVAAYGDGMELEQRVTNLIANHLGVPAGDVTREASLLDDLTGAWNRAGILEIIERSIEMCETEQHPGRASFSGNDLFRTSAICIGRSR